MINLFLTHLQSEDITRGTLENYRANLKLFSEWWAGRPISQVTQADIKQYKEALKQRYKPSTINKKLSQLSMFFRWCVEMGYTDKNPVNRIKPVEYELYPRWLNSGQVSMVLKTAQNAIKKAKAKGLNFTANIAARTQAIVVVLLNTGLRASELCDLQLSDIKGDVLIVRWGKGSKRREIPLNAQAKEALQSWLKVRQSDSSYVFVTDGRMTRQLVQWHLSELGDKLGIRLTPHVLRHTFGKSLVDRGVSLDRVAKLMGHTDINTTKIYTMPSLDDLRSAIKSLDP